MPCPPWWRTSRVAAMILGLRRKVGSMVDNILSYIQLHLVLQGVQVELFLTPRRSAQQGFQSLILELDSKLDTKHGRRNVTVGVFGVAFSSSTQPKNSSLFGYEYATRCGRKVSKVMMANGWSLLKAHHTRRAGHPPFSASFTTCVETETTRTITVRSRTAGGNVS